MPAIGAALAGLLASAAATVLLPAGINATLATIISGTVGLLVSTGMSLLLNRAPSVARTDVQAADRKQAVRSGIAPRNIVYGRSLVAGPVIFMSSEGTYNEWLHIVMPLAGHPVHAFDAVRINGYVIPVTTDTAGGDGTAGDGVGDVAGFACNVYVRIRAGTEQGTIPGADIRTDAFDPEADLFRDAVLHIRLYDGTQATADNTLLSTVPSEWDEDMILTGLPYIAVRLRYSQDVFGGGFQSLAVELRGKKLWDPRDDSTTYTDNAALCVLDYLMSDYGLGVPSAEIDTEAAGAAANICEEDVATDVAETLFQDRYTINGSFKLDQTPIDIMEGLLNGWGTLVYVQGLYRIHAAAAESSSVSLTASDFAGPVEIVRNQPRRDIINAITGTYVEPSQGWEPLAFPKVVSAAQLADDGEEIAASLDLPFVIDAYRAQRLARLRLLTQRAAGFQVRAAMKYSTIRVAVWDVIDLTLPEFGLDEDTFRVTSYTFDPVSGLVTLVLQSDVAAAYAWTASDGEEPLLSEVTALVSPLAIPQGEEPTVAVAYRTQADGTVVPRLDVSWSATPPTPYITMIEIQYRDVDTSEAWRSMLVPPTESATVIEPIQTTHDYEVRLRYHATLIRGAWSAYAEATGEGNEADAPLAPSGAAVVSILGGYRVTFTKATAADIAATEVGEDVTPFEGTIDYVAETTGTQLVRMVASGDYAERRVYVRSRNTGGQRTASWLLVGTVTPQTAATVDLAANSVTNISASNTITRQEPSSTTFADTDVVVTVTVGVGEKVVIQYIAHLEEYLDGDVVGGGAEGGSEDGGSDLGGSGGLEG